MEADIATKHAEVVRINAETAMKLQENAMKLYAFGQACQLQRIAALKTYASEYLPTAYGANPSDRDKINIDDSVRTTQALIREDVMATPMYFVTEVTGGTKRKLEAITDESSVGADRKHAMITDGSSADARAAAIAAHPREISIISVCAMMKPPLCPTMPQSKAIGRRMASNWRNKYGYSKKEQPPKREGRAEGELIAANLYFDKDTDIMNEAIDYVFNGEGRHKTKEVDKRQTKLKYTRK
jgi:hypothetical protein